MRLMMALVVVVGLAAIDHVSLGCVHSTLTPQTGSTLICISGINLCGLMGMLIWPCASDRTEWG